MKLISVILAAAGVANAHYNFPGLVVNGQTVGSNWQYVRRTKNYQSNGPVTDVNSGDIRCYEDGTPAETYTVSAGSTVGFTANSAPYHPGPLQFYMARAPGSVADWDGSGSVWFKIYGEGPEFSNSGLTWANNGRNPLTVRIPSSVPEGEYLLRIEQIGLHSASSAGGAQFYIACAQLKVTGGGGGSPNPTVSLPGAYSATDPGIMINIYYPVPTSYTLPGPPVWSG